MTLESSTYFSHAYTSNSDLSKLAQELSGTDAFNYAQAQKMGTLIHALLLEPHTVDLIRNRVGNIEYTPEEMKQGRLLSVYTKNYALCRNLIDQCDKEVEVYTESVSFEYNGIAFTLDCRCKYDFKKHGVGGDFKTTTATSMKQFLEEIERFQYHRARVFYSKVSGIQKDVIIGINKKYKGIFPVFMEPSGELWKRGEELMNELAFKFWMLKG